MSVFGRRYVPSLDGVTEWLNSGPLGHGELAGHVVAYQFCTYTCVNWLRTLPYVRAWADRYRDQGLIVIGIHTPEFAFEREIANVREAMAADRITYPVAIDNDYVVWHAFGNEYWPALYVADTGGVIRHRQFGENGYPDSEAAVRQLLAEPGAGDQPGSAGQAGGGHAGAGPVDGGQGDATEADAGQAGRVDAQGVEVAADWDRLGSPETYLGFGRGERLVAERDRGPARSGAYIVPRRLRLNQWALSGKWTIGQDSAVLGEAPGTIAYRFRARDVNLVLWPAQGEVPFRVMIDGQPPGTSHGADCDTGGFGVVSRPRLYQLIRRSDTVDERTFEIAFTAPGIAAYVFTFG
jgi:hypothetical protein